MKLRSLILCALILLGPAVRLCHAVEVLVVADARLKPVTEIISGLAKTLKTPFKIYAPSEVATNLGGVVEREAAKVVVALGRDALIQALRLPSSVLVIYDLVVIPPAITRPNTTGFYMATPAREYADLLSSYLPGLSRVAVVGGRDHLQVLARGDSRLSLHSVRNSVEFVKTLRQLNSYDAILLLPDVSVLSSAALEEAYLLSFRKRIPILGISEKHVKDGALLALVVDMGHVGKVIGEYATRAVRGANIGQLPPSPPKKFELFVNLDTARKMGIRLPDDLIRSAKRAYP